MRFDTKTLIRLAYRNGMTLTRSGGFIHVQHPFDHLPALWEEAFKRHKPALLKALPDREQARQLDLFYDDY
jgi:hypothetical protein